VEVTARLDEIAYGFSEESPEAAAQLQRVRARDVAKDVGPPLGYDFESGCVHGPLETARVDTPPERETGTITASATGR
jgi:hypothetical protein